MKRVVKKGITHLIAEWDNMRASLWFIPAVLTLLTGVLAVVLVALDKRYYQDLSAQVPWLFEGSASAARSLLSTLAASVITVISIAFSLTVIAVQQASVQFTPRVLRTFTSDRGNQVVLGTYLATFVYSLLVLRTIRDPQSGNDSGFVPALATTTAILLALICIALLIYFINHIVNSLQATTIISRVHHDLLRQIDKLYPEHLGEGASRAEWSENPDAWSAEHTVEIAAGKGGFVTLIDEGALRQAELAGVSWLRIYPKVGDFIVAGQVIAHAGTRVESNGATPNSATPNRDATRDDIVRQEILTAIVVENQRSLAQDPMFAVRQLVDMGVKALSPGINDPTTANYCIRYLGDAMCRLSRRAFPENLRTFQDRRTLLWVNRPTWEEFVVGSFVQLQQNASGKVRVTEAMLRVLCQLALAVPNKQRADPIRRVTGIIEEQVAIESLAKTEKSLLKEEVGRVLAILDQKA